MMSLNIMDFSNCDGKKCGQGRYVGGGSFVCPHNNFAAKYPNLAAQWHPTKNQTRPEDYTYGSKFKAWWKCPNDPCGCHEWQAEIRSRSKGHGCRFCNGNGKNKSICPHNNLAFLYPKLA